jgi:hypothetical protein
MPPTMLPIDHPLSNPVALDVSANEKAKLNSNSPPFDNSSSLTAPLEIKNPWDLSGSDGLYVTCSSTRDGTRKSSCIEYRARDDEFTDGPTTRGCYYNNVGKCQLQPKSWRFPVSPHSLLVWQSCLRRHAVNHQISDFCFFVIL